MVSHERHCVSDHLILLKSKEHQRSSFFFSFLFYNFCTILKVLFHFFSEWGRVHSLRTCSSTEINSRTPHYSVLSSMEVKKIATQEMSKFPRHCHVCKYHFTPRIQKICHFHSSIQFNILIKLINSLWPSDITWWHHQMASDVEPWCFLWLAPEQTVEQTIGTLIMMSL